MFALIVRRLLWMIPTLAIISFISFGIIQLPPGDYLTSYISAMEASGERVEVEKAEALRKRYDLDKPFIVQYGKWMGKLVRGDMGMSFEWNRPVRSLIGERLLLSMSISFVALAFTWALAVPIGIYSAVRQYSIGDYFFTFVGFIGLATPNFLLALVFVVVAEDLFGINATKLFSEAYQNAPWSVGRVLDFLMHIWVPVVIIGTAGTAGLIRVMRGNLLDELRKAYVVTARAKGVPRIKRLLKYPVRVALNPLVSTIGWVLPGIVSGEVIVSMVLNMPTTGPLLLRALMNQDMYLAGSMIMMLSMLTVVGTLVSDLLLLWLDPRIRYEAKEA